MKLRGFTLIELIITLAVAAIILLMAGGVYIDYVNITHRAEGKAGLFELAGALEQYYLGKNTYLDANFAVLQILSTTINGYYQLSIDRLEQEAYVISAVPLFRDNLCGKLQLNQLGEESIGGSGTLAQCW